MTRLSDGIKGMIGSLWSNFLGTVVRDHPEIFGKGFHTGGLVPPIALPYGQLWDEKGRLLGTWPAGTHGPFGGRMADDLAQRQIAKRDLHVNISMVTPKSRKRPITDDMAQMCQDLGIEPSLSYEDLCGHLQKLLADSMGLTFEQLRERWAR